MCSFYTLIYFNTKKMTKEIYKSEIIHNKLVFPYLIATAGINFRRELYKKIDNSLPEGFNEEHKKYKQWFLYPRRLRRKNKKIIQILEKCLYETWLEQLAWLKRANTKIKIKYNKN